MKTGVRITKLASDTSVDWVATECEPQGKDTYVRVLKWFPTLEAALEAFPGAEVEDGTAPNTVSD